MSDLIDWPLDQNRIRRGLIAHTFGLVRRNSAGQRRVHQGWDFEAVPGTPCYAIAEGWVEMIYHSPDYGMVLVLGFCHNGEKLFAAYAHLSATCVNVGDRVVPGTFVARSGESGNARGLTHPDQHLHFEIRTMPRPGLGRQGRKSPIEVFGQCPLNETIKRRGRVE